MGKASRKKSQKNREKKQAVQRNARDLRKGTGVFKDRQVSFLLFAVLTLTFLTFAPTFLNDFTNWDDDMYIRDNPLVQSLSSDNIETMFAPDEEAFVGGNYHPLTILTLAINYQISGLKPWSYQLFNILLHLLNTFLVFLLLYRLTKGKSDIALIAALLFGIHPMHVESVTWVAERKDVLYTAFFLGGMLSYLNYIRKPGYLQLGVTFILFTLSLLSKPAAVVFPVLLFLFDYFEKRPLKAKLFLEKIPFFVLSLLMGLFTIDAQKASDAYGGLAKFDIFDRLMFAGYGFTMYLVRFFVPYKLSAFYPYPESSPLPAEFYISSAIAFLILAYTLWSMRKTRILAFSVGFYAINLALVLQFVTVGSAILADRYTYVPYIGISFLIGYAYHKIRQSPETDLRKYAQPLLILIVSGALILSLLAWQRVRVWKNSETLFTNVIKNYPRSAVAYQNRGHYFRTQSGREKDPAKKAALLKKALDDYNKGLAVNPGNAVLYSNRGKVWFDRKEFQKALEDYNRSLAIKSDDPQTLSNRGAARGMLGDLEGALQDFNRAIEVDPKNPNGYFNRGILYGQLGEPEKAIADYRKYLSYKPGNAGLHNSIGVELQKLGRNEEALKEFNTAIRLNPKEAAFYINKSVSHFKLGQISEARKSARQAQRLGAKISPSYLKEIGIK
jgi:tetratricopeptide (TPR) repeat protein